MTSAIGPRQLGRARCLVSQTLVALLVSLVPVETASAIEARVAASLEPSGRVWVGQRVTLRLDLKNTDSLPRTAVRGKQRARQRK